MHAIIAAMNEKTGEPERAGIQEDVGARLDRTEAALRLVVGHLQAATRGNEIMSAEQTRIVLPAVGLGVSATAIIALWSIASGSPELAGRVLRFSLAMSLLFLASAVDVSSAAFLRRAVSKAVQQQEPDHPALHRDPWHRALRPGTWASARAASPDLLAHRVLRGAALVVYVLALLLTLWGLLSLG